VEPQERGDPVPPLRWTAKSTRALAAELTCQGHRVGADTVGGLLREEGFSLQGNVKAIEGRRHPDRDAQFRYINDQAKDHQASGDPVVSVDTKKKEQVGNYANAGREYRPKGRPVRVHDHDFPDPRGLGKAIPYGIYDLAADAGWVNVGTDADTAAFAVESIRRWWRGAGQDACPGASRLLITAGAGGSNGYRTRAWKAGLAALAAETGLEITCCHFPPGTSKWNKIEHRLFSHITMNWRGRPLTSHEDDGLHGHAGIQGGPQARQRSPASARRRPAAETTGLEVFLPCQGPAAQAHPQGAGQDYHPAPSITSVTQATALGGCRAVAGMR